MTVNVTVTVLVAVVIVVSVIHGRETECRDSVSRVTRGTTQCLTRGDNTDWQCLSHTTAD